MKKLITSLVTSSPLSFTHSLILAVLIVASPGLSLFVVASTLPQQAAAQGVIYAATNDNELMWYRHDGRGDGSFRWTGPKKVGNGWNFKQIFSGGDGVVYGITNSGDLMWYRHDGRGDGSFRWTEPKKVGNGWDFKQIFSGGGGVIYGITNSGDLMWYRHDGYADGSFRWTGPKKVGNGWDFKDIFADEPGS